MDWRVKSIDDRDGLVSEHVDTSELFLFNRPP